VLEAHLLEVIRILGRNPRRKNSGHNKDHEQEASHKGGRVMKKVIDDL